MGREEPVKANHIESRWRNHGAQTRDEVEGLEHDGARAVAPDAFHFVAQSFNSSLGSLYFSEANESAAKVSFFDG